jgi:restriction endonuclease S subunit
MISTLVIRKDIVQARRWDFEYFDPEYTDILTHINQSGWPVKRLSEIVQNLTDGQHGYLKHLPDGVPLLRTTNVFEHEIKLDDVRYIAPEVHAEIKRSQLRPGDVLLTTIGSIGVAAVVDDSIGEANINQNLVKMAPNVDVNSWYLALFFNSRPGRAQVERAASKSVVPIVTYARLRDLLVPLPPRPIQDRIAQVMREAYATRREKLAEAETLVEGINQFLLKELQIDFAGVIRDKRFKIESSLIVGNRFDVDFHLPQIRGQYKTLKGAENHKLIPLGELVEQMANGATPRGANYQTEGIPFFRIQNITPDGIDLLDVRYISRDTHKEMKRSQTRPGDLLMTITGRVGTAAVIPETIKEGNINQHIVILRLKPGVIDVHYLAAIINSSIVEFQAKHRTTGTTRIALDYSAVKSLLIPVPPMETQKSLTEAIAYRRSEAKRLRTEAETIVAEAKAHMERMILGQEEAG